jgi:hypothetical protein
MDDNKTFNPTWTTWLHATLSLILLAVLSWCIPGCSQYRFGNQGLYRADVRTIHIPIVRSDSLRPDIGVRLTEILQKTVEERTPFKIVSDATADSVLVCRLTTEAKQLVSETAQDDPRLLRAVMTVECSWTDRRGNVLMENRFLPPGEVALYFATNAMLVPESGESLATSQLWAMNRLANHIVDQMEVRW